MPLKLHIGEFMNKNILIILSALILSLAFIDLQSAYEPTKNEYQFTKDDLAFQEKSELYKTFSQGKLILTEIREKILKKQSEQTVKYIQEQIQLNDLSVIVHKYSDDLILDSRHLSNFFHLCMTDEIITKIDQFLKNSESQVTSLLHNNKFEQYRDKQVRSIHRPHTPDFTRKMERNGFVFSPQLTRLDRMVCGKCEAEAFGLAETDIPQYYHKANCKFAIGRNCDIDCTLKILQRLSYLLTNYQINFSSKSDSEMFKNKKIKFYNFFLLLGNCQDGFKQIIL